MTVENPRLAHLGAKWWVTDDYASPRLSKASLGEFFHAVLKTGAQIGEIWAFAPQHPRSPVIVAVFMTEPQRLAIEAATKVRFRPPPTVKVGRPDSVPNSPLPRTDPMEVMIEDTLAGRGIPYLTERANDAELDFYLPDEAVYIEVKQFHTPRVNGQMAKVDNIIVAQGRKAVALLARLLRAQPARPPADPE